MNKMMIALLALALAITAMAFAQSGQQMQNDQQIQNDKTTQQQQNQAATVDQTGQTTMPRHSMTGMVSNNGKSFTSDNKTYQVNNPKALKNYDNQTVMIQFKFNTDNNTIRVLSASPAQSQ